VAEAHAWKTERGVPQIVYNADYWQELAQARLLNPPDDSNSISIYGAKPEKHRRLAEEITSQQLLERVQGETFALYNWTVPRGPNDLLDCLKGCLAQYVLYRGADYLEQPQTHKKGEKKEGNDREKENDTQNKEYQAKLDRLRELVQIKESRRRAGKSRG